MRAKSLQKKSTPIEEIYKWIESSNNVGDFKIFIPHFKHVDESVRLQLIEDGFKIYRGDWDGITTNALIIEW